MTVRDQYKDIEREREKYVPGVEFREAMPLPSPFLSKKNISFCLWRGWGGLERVKE